MKRKSKMKRERKNEKKEENEKKEKERKGKERKGKRKRKRKTIRKRKMKRRKRKERNHCFQGRSINMKRDIFKSKVFSFFYSHFDRYFFAHLLIKAGGKGKVKESEGR